MVNNELRDQRKLRIDNILNILKKHKITNRTEFVMQICVKYGVQQRKAAEYLRIAEFMNK